MSVKYAGGGGGSFWNILGTLASVFIPGAGPYIAGANLLSSVFSGKPEDAAMQAVGMVAPTKGVPSPGASPSGFSVSGLASKMNSIGPAAGAQVADVADAGAQVADVADAGAQVADASKYAQLVSMYGNSPENYRTARQEAIRGGYESIPSREQTQWENLLTRYPTLFRRR